jgi:hypothetical protein
MTWSGPTVNASNTMWSSSPGHRSGPVVVVDLDQKHTLLLWRHRHITDAWDRRIPAGWADPTKT